MARLERRRRTASQTMATKVSSNTHRMIPELMACKGSFHSSGALIR